MVIQTLPNGWCLAKISDVSIKSQQKKPCSDEVFIYVDIGSIDRDQKKIANPQYMKGDDAPSRARKVINSGDILVSLTRPNLNAVALVGSYLDFQIASTGFEVIKPLGVESGYIFSLVRSRDFIEKISGSVQGALYPAAKSSDVQNFEFPLAPLAEQKIIAEKLDSLLAQVESTKARLERIPQILKRFRQSVLAAAVSGKLTEEWRISAQNHDQWEIVAFNELLYKIRSGNSNKAVDESDGVKILRSSAVRSLKIDFNDARFLLGLGEEKDLYYLENGDLLFTRLSGSAEYVGNCALVKDFVGNIQYPDRLFCAKLKDRRYARYLEIFFSSDVFREYILREIKSSAGHQRITLETLKKSIVNLPPYEEQTEIVRRVDQLFAYADTIEKQVNAALERANNLTQAILAKAFRGELTAQWRAENPELISGENSAEALLERIKAERAAQAPKKGRARKVTT